MSFSISNIKSGFAKCGIYPWIQKKEERARKGIAKQAKSLWQGKEGDRRGPLLHHFPKQKRISQIPRLDTELSGFQQGSEMILNHPLEVNLILFASNA